MIKTTNLNGKEFTYDDLQIHRAINAVWSAYEKTDSESLNNAHSILCSAVYGKVEAI